MSVLHPVGPEPARTYWLRRALVLGVLVVVLALLTALLVGGDQPAGVTATPVATPLPSDGGTSSPLSGTADPTDADSAEPSDTRSSDGAQSSTSAPPSAAAPPCDPAQLRTTLTGAERLKPQQATTFDLSLINGSTAACVVEVTPTNFELKILSGSDRIWSSRDCATSVKPVTSTLDSEKAVEWQVRWNGRRSAPGCATRPAVPKTGTYVVTGQLTGARPVQLRMVLAG